MRYLIICILLLTACNPCKRLVKLCPPSDSIAYIETIDTVIVTVPESTTEIEFHLGDIGLTEENEDQVIQIITKDSTIYVRATCKEQEAEIFNLRKQLTSQKTVIERVEIPTYVKHVPRYYRICGIAAPVLFLLIAFFVYLRIRKV